MTIAYQTKIVVCTGGGSGIGKALCLAFARAGAHVIVADLRGAGLAKADLPFSERHLAVEVDVTDPVAVARMVRSVKERYRRIDIYCSNAGILLPGHRQDDSCAKHSPSEWNAILQVNLLSHVIALKELLPDWERGIGEGHFCVTASAAGLLTMVGDASYGVSKAAALSFCEHVAISHPCVRVHCLCPQAVDTPLVAGSNESNAALSDGLLSPETVAALTLEGIQKGDFFIFPHPTVAKYALRKAQDHSRWIKGMQRMRNQLYFDPKPSNEPGIRSKL